MLNVSLSGGLTLPNVKEIVVYTGDRHPHVGESAQMQQIEIKQTNLHGLTVNHSAVSSVSWT